MIEENSALFGRSQARSGLSTQLLQYGVALLSVALGLGINLLFHSYLEPTPTPVFFAAVMVSVWYGGLGPGLFATVLSTLAINYFYIEPTYSLNVTNFAYIVRMSIFVIVALLINALNQAQRSAQQKAEASLQALRESEARFGCLAESNLLGMVVADLHGAILEANQTFLQMVGYTEEALRAGRLNWREITSPESLEVSENAVQELLTTGTCTPFEKEYIRQDGSRVPVLHGAVMTGESTVAGFVLDLGERKQTETALRQSEARFQVLVRNMPGMIYRYAPHGGGRHLFTYVSSGSRELVELEPEIILQDANSFLSLIHPDDLSSFQNSIQIAIENSAVWHWEGRIITPSGRLKWVQGRSRPQQTEYGAAWDGLFFDVTDRRQAEAALRQSEERLRVALKTSPITVFNQDQDLRYTWIYNSAIDPSVTETIGKQDKDLFSRGDAAKLTEIKQRVLTRGIGLREEVKLTLQEQTFYYDMTAEPLLNADGEIIGITCACIDITDRKQMELALRQSQTTLSALIASSPIGIALFDRDFRYVHVNEALAVTNGIPAQEHIGRRFWEVLPQWSPAIVPLLQHVIDTKEPLLNQEVAGVTHPFDKVRHGLVNYFPVCLPEGEVLGVGVTSMDITDRRHMEESLRQSEERYRAIYDQVLVGIAQASLTGKLLNVNERYCEMVGRSQEELLTLRMQDITHPDDLPHNLVLFQRMLEDGTSFEIEKRYIRPDGSPVWVRNYVSLIRDAMGNPQCCVAVTEDITERKQAEKTLRDSEERFQLIAQATNDVMWDHDLLNQTAWWSERVQLVFGYQPEELGTGMEGWAERVHPDDRERAYASYEACLNGSDSIWTEEYRFRRADGSYAAVFDRAFIIRDFAGNPVRVVGAISDITDRKKVQQELQQTLQTLQTIVAASPLPIVVIELDMTVRVWNAAAEQLFGWSEAELLGQPIPFVPVEKMEECRQIRKAIGNGEVFYGVETYRCKRDGSKVIVNISAAPLYDDHENVTEILLILQDITAQQQAAAEREQLLTREKAAREQAETANRIKDEFLAVLSHELRSPLNPILGWSQLLQTQKLDQRTTQQALATIERNAKLQTQLIEDLLDVSRILRGKLVLNMAPVSLINTIEASLETVRLAVEAKGIHIQKVFNLDRDQVMGDAARLQQIFWNLLTNAVKFTPSGGTVEIHLACSNTYAQIQVKDTGKGINPDFLPHVFDYFRQEDGTTTRKFGGLGLGLAIVRHLVELHGGSVWAESLGEGLGATFTVQLPLVGSRELGDGNGETIGSPLLPSPFPLVGIRVLTVDDDADIRELVEFILQQAGAEVRVFSSATEVLQQLEAFSPEVLIFDIGMPDMDGYMLMRQIRTRLPKMVPAIALTAYAGEIDQQQALSAGFQMHLSKPVEPEKLIRAIVTLCNEHQPNEP